VAFFNTAQELTRRCDQNKNDIEEIYKQGKKTAATVEQLLTDVGNLTTQVGDVETKVDTLTTRVDSVETKVDTLTTRVDSVETKVDTGFDQVGKRFDRLERILTQQPMVDPASPLDFLPPEHEVSIRLLESKMNLFSSRTRENTDELARLRQLHAAHDERFTAHDRRFDALDNQMAEVLTILRAKSA